MAGITAIGDLSHTLESIFEDVVEGRLARSRAMIDLLQLAQDRLVEMLEQVRNNAPLSNADDLINRIHALARGTNEIEETEPLEAAAAPSYDANLAAAFMRQAEEILESCDARLQSWALHDDKLPIVRELEGELHALGTAAATAAGGPGPHAPRPGHPPPADAEPAIYPYDQEYSVPGGRGRKIRRGFIALCRLEDYAAGVVHRHEETHTGPKADRLELLKHTRAHFGQIFVLYSDPAGAAERAEV